MRSIRWIARSLCALAVPIVSGCMAPGPYGYPNYPGYYGPPPQNFVAPPGTPMSPGSFPTPQLAPSTPLPPPGSGSNWSPTTTPTPATPPSGLNSGPPPFSGPTTGARKIDDPVPDPMEEANPRVPLPGPSPRPGASSGPSGSNNTPFGSPDSSQKTFGEGTQLSDPPRVEGAVQSVAAASDEAFQPPVEGSGRPKASGVVSIAARTSPGKTSAIPASRYDYDPIAYSWLRGKVAYDTRDNSWQIIYNPTPTRRDRYGGALRLADNSKLKELHSGDFVFVEGRVNPLRRDRQGKPQYEIEGEQIARITYTGKPLAN